jgi:polygalacturonase
MYCTHFTLQGVTILDPPFWAVHPYACDDVLVEDVVFSAPVTSPNTDGIDPDSCSNVVIRNFTASCGDDAIAIKSGKDEYGRAFNIPSRDILIEGGVIGPSSAINIGSEMSGGVYNVLVRGVLFKGGLFSTRIKSARGRGGYVKNITVEDVFLLDNVMGPGINMFYASGEQLSPTDVATPHISDITYRRHSGNALTAGAFLCLPEAPCTNIIFDDFNISSKIGGLECINAYGSSIGDVMSPESCLKDPRTVAEEGNN